MWLESWSFVLYDISHTSRRIVQLKTEFKYMTMNQSITCCYSVTQSCLTLCDTMNCRTTVLHHHLPCPSLSPGVCSNLCPLSQWCHPTSSTSVTRFSSCPQSFPASGSFPMNQLFVSGDPSIGASAQHHWSIILTSLNSPKLQWAPLIVMVHSALEHIHFIQQKLGPSRTSP